jgi:hypothetical protein
MKKDEVEVGGTYLAKVGTRMVEVRVERENGRGGWDASSVATGKPIRLKDPKHLRPVKAAKGATSPAAGAGQPEAASAGDGPQEPASGDGGPDAGAAEGAAPERKPGRKGTAKAKPAKAERPAKAPRADAKPKPMSCLDAAAAVLKAKGEPMNCKALVEAMAEQNLWKSDAPTPAATLSSAILREMTKKGGASRFRKTSPGHFTFTEPKGD